MSRNLKRMLRKNVKEKVGKSDGEGRSEIRTEED